LFLIAQQDHNAEIDPLLALRQDGRSRMKISRRQCLVLFMASLPRLSFSPKALEREWREIATQTDGTVGAAALHLKTGMSVSLNATEKFPLASVCKLPIAMNMLSIVDEGKLRLTDEIDIPPQAVWPGVSVIADHWATVRRYTLDEMVSLMVARSDNTAVEALWRIGGGAHAMANRFRQWGIDGIRLDRSERECGLNSAGITRFPQWAEWTPTLLDELISKVPASTRDTAMRAFISDPRDTATPRATVELLKRTFSGALLSRSSTARMIQILESTTTGGARLKGLLPPGTVVAHKTGTTDTAGNFNGGTNDVGVVTLPNNSGKFAIAVYIKGSTANAEIRERVIARIARSAFDAWSNS
jgi:beta-lactamase class A